MDNLNNISKFGCRNEVHFEFLISNVGVHFEFLISNFEFKKEQLKEHFKFRNPKSEMLSEILYAATQSLHSEITLKACRISHIGLQNSKCSFHFAIRHPKFEMLF